LGLEISIDFIDEENRGIAILKEIIKEDRAFFAFL